MGIIRMARPTLRKGSTYIQFDRRIPTEVADRVRGLTLLIPVGPEVVKKRISETAIHIKLSLRTRDKAEGAIRNAEVEAYLQRVYSGLLTDVPVKLTHKECFAIAGVFYQEWLRDPDRKLSKVQSLNNDGTWTTRVVEGDPIQVALGSSQDDPDVDPLDPDSPSLRQRLVSFLRDSGIRADDSSIEMLMKAMPPTLMQAYEQKKREASGDYSPDPNAVRFPPISAVTERHAPRPASTKRGKADGLTLTELFAQWKDSPDQRADAKSPGIAQSTIASYATVFRQLGAFLKHEDVRRITRDDIEAYLKHRRAQGISRKTVVAVDRAAIRSIFNWAAENRIIQDNPAAILWKPKKRREGGTRGEKDLTEAEAIAILRHASAYRPKSKREGRKLTAAKFWVPWLMAYTGLRVGEVAQLRKQDILEHRGHWAVAISFEAGTTKSKSTWHVPLHSQLVDLGFLSFVRGAPDGHLFLTPRPDLYDPASPESRTKDERGILGPLKTLQNDLAAFAREVVKRTDVKPNHGWRHRFKTVGRAAGIEDSTLDAFNDHAGRIEADRYGQFYPAMVEALKKIPRYDVEL